MTVYPGDAASRALPAVNDGSNGKVIIFISQERTRPYFFPGVITVVHWQHYTAVISLKVYVRAGSCTDTRNIISEFKITALRLTCSTQLWGGGGGGIKIKN